MSLQEYLIDYICLDTRESLCESINEIGPYVSGLSIDNTITVKHLRRYANARIRLGCYHEFRIPKKSGGFRTITAPDGQLKHIMTALAFILTYIYHPTPTAMAFVPCRSIVDNAGMHVNHNYVFNIDLCDFFSSITTDMIEYSLIRQGINSMVARDISTICCYPVSDGTHTRNILPQGAPTSPVLSNICAQTLDQRLTGLAQRFHLTYTRYADDITFSSDHNVYHDNGAFIQELRAIIAECHFVINTKKTRLQKRGSRQEVTGLTVNERPNVSRRYIKNLRAMIHHIELDEHPSCHAINVARGKLNFLRMVKGENDSTYIRLVIKLNLAVRGKHFASDTPTV